MKVSTVYFLLSLLILIWGVVMKFKPPKTINSLIGFRTGKSSASQKNWDLAQELCAKSFIIISIVSAIIFAVILASGVYADLSENAKAMFLFIPVVLLLLSIPYVNKKLPDKVK